MPDIDAAQDRFERDSAYFRDLVSQAREYFGRGRDDAAAVYASMAAFQALKRLPIFSSPELEEILLGIGNHDRLSVGPLARRTRSVSEIRNVLHVATDVTQIGGLSRLIWRWVQRDERRSHSLVLTEQNAQPMPRWLTEAIAARNGRVHELDARPGNIISWAKQLRRLAASADIVVLHIAPLDVISVIAFANKNETPPTLYIDHADHIFWLGTSVSDVVVNLRGSGQRLAREARGVQDERSMLLPTPLSPVEASASRSEARRKLGLGEDSVVLLTVARGIKYRSFDGSSYADAFLPVLERFDKVRLLAVGPSADEDWLGAGRRTQGRVAAVGPQENTSPYFGAADIYVDSFPIVSITSLLEGGLHSLPLITRNSYPDALGVLGADAPGLDGDMIRVSTAEEQTTHLARLIEDRGYREELGARTRRSIEQSHVGAGWMRQLEEIYKRAMTVPPITKAPKPAWVGWPADYRAEWLRVYGQELAPSYVYQFRLRHMPSDLRLRAMVANDIRRPALLLPHWLAIRIKKLTARRRG